VAKPSSKTADEKARIVVTVLKGELTAVEAAPTLTPSNTCYTAAPVLCHTRTRSPGAPGRLKRT